MFHSFCAGPLLVVEGRELVDGGWFCNVTEGGTNASFADAVGFWVMVLKPSRGASADNGVANVASTEAAMTINGGRGTLFIVMFTGSAITAILGTSNSLASTVSGEFITVLVVDVVVAAAADTATIVVASKSVIVEGGSDVVIRALLVGGATSFGAGHIFLGD